MPHPRNLLLFLSLAALCSCGGRSRHAEMLRQLSEAEEMNRNFVMMDTLRGIDAMTDYFMAHGTSEERMRANYMMGCVYRDRGDSPMALQFFLTAASQADTTASDCNYGILCRVYSQMGEVYLEQRHPWKMLETFDRAAAYAQRARDTLAHVNLTYRKAAAYRLLDDYDKSQQIALDCYRRYKEIGHDEYASAKAVNIATYYLRRNEPEKAKPFLEEGLRSENWVDKDRHVHPGKEILYYYLGNYFEQVGNLDSALYYYERLNQTGRIIMHREAAGKGLMSVYQKLHQSDSVMKYAQMFADANDSANVQHSAEEVSRLQALYDYSEHQRQAQIKTEENNTLWRIVLLSAIAAIAGIAAFWIYRLRQKQKQQALHQQIVRLRQFEKILQEQNEATVARQNLVRQRLLESEACQLLRQAVADDRPLHDADIAMIDQTVNQICDGFRSTLYSAYNLSAQEYAVCLLLKFELPATDISRLLNRTKSAITHARKRLFVKLFGHEGGANELDTYIRSL